MTGHLDRLRQVARAATLMGVISAPVSVIAHQQPTKPAAAIAIQAPKPTAPAKPATPAPASAPSTHSGAPSFSDLRAALARIQQRVTAKMGASAAPQTAMTALPKTLTPPKPAETPAKPAEPAAKPADSAAKAAGAPPKPATTAVVEAAKPTTPAASATEMKLPQGPRIQLNWRAPLIWPKEIGGFGPSDESPAPATSSSGITTKRITLVWK